MGCQGAAKAIVEGKVPVTVCVGGGLDVVDALAQIMEAEYTHPGKRLAVVNCLGAYRMEKRFQYLGLRDCRAAALLFGGSVICETGCLGGGTCAAVCPFGAISAEESP